MIGFSIKYKISFEQIRYYVHLLVSGVDEFRPSEVWVIMYKLLRCIDISFQRPFTVMHSSVKLIDLYSKCSTACIKKINRYDFVIFSYTTKLST